MLQRNWVFILEYFAIDKKGSGKRLILDLRLLNKHLHVSKFRMLSLHQVLSLFDNGLWFVKLDLKDEFFHIAIHESCRFLRFRYGGGAYPFGLSTAPRVFTMFT